MIRLVASVFRRKIIGAASLGLLALALWIRLGSIPSTLLENKRATSTIVVDRNGVPLYEARAEDGTRAISLSAETLPPVLVAATIAAEDRRFWQHPGIDPVAMLRAAKRVTTPAGEVRLTPTEWHVVEVLVRNAGKLVTQRQLLQEVWGPQYGTETNYLRVYLAQIRRKLEPDPSRPRYFVTEARMGYRFEPNGPGQH